LLTETEEAGAARENGDMAAIKEEIKKLAALFSSNCQEQGG